MNVVGYSWLSTGIKTPEARFEQGGELRNFSSCTLPRCLAGKDFRLVLTILNLCNGSNLNSPFGILEHL